MTYLADTSALVRIWRNQADPKWGEAADRGHIAVCEPVLTGFDAKQYTSVEGRTRGTYPYVTVPDAVWDQVQTIRNEPALRSAHQGPSVVDLVVASTAMRRQLTVLHDDRDYRTVARFVPYLKEQRISADSQ